MDIEYFASGATLEDEDPSGWERIKSVLRDIDLPYTCILGAEDYASKIALVLEQEGERQNALLYPKHKFLQLTKMELTRDIFERAQRPIGQKIEIIQSVFNHFQLMHEWPLSRQMSVDLRKLGDYYKSAKEIGTQFIITGEDHVEDAITTLSVYGVSLCSGAKEYLDTFLKILKFLLHRFIEMSESPVVSSEELVDEEIDLYGDDYTLYEIISRESDLTNGSSYKKNGEFTLNVSPRILKYEDVNTIEDYLRIAYYPRIWEQTEDNAEPYTEKAIEIVGPEGIIVTQSKSSEKFDYDLFISYSKPDRVEARKIEETAKKFGLVCFLSEKSIESGADWDEEIFLQAIPNSRESVFLMTPDSIKKPWIHAEWGAVKALKKRYTPILYRCAPEDLPLNMRERQARDYSDLEAFFAEVLRRKNA